MEKLTASNLVRFIDQLDKRNAYHYVNLKSKGLIRIEHIEHPEGPIRFRRGQDSSAIKSAKIESISSEMIWRIANAIEPKIPINLDRVLGASYNTRSVLEALLAHTPEFYYCYPGRVETTGGKPKVKRGHKHLMWLPDQPHGRGKLLEAKTEIVISEIPTQQAYYESLLLAVKPEEPTLDIETARRHAQIQIALYFIGLQLGYRTWIAKNDHGIVYEKKRILEYPNVVQSLKEERLFALQNEIIEAAMLIDCIWFKNGTLLPAIMEVEHSTGITSGLTRMKKLQSISPGFKTRYVIVAPDNLRSKVKKEANESMFRDLKTQFFPYSAVEELYSLCQRRKLQGVTQDFLDCFMEKMVES